MGIKALKKVFKNKREAVFFLILIIGLGLWGIKALFQPGFYTSHDGFSHLPRLAQYIELLRDGQIPPRWSGSLNGRLGYPIFVYSYHLPFLIGSWFYSMGLSLVSSLKAVFGLSFIVSGIGAYFWLKEFFSAKASFLGAIFFLFAPYRFILMLVRASAGEVVAVGLLPVILYFLTRLIKQPSLKNLSLASLALAGGITAHSLFVIMYLPIIMIYGLVIIVALKIKERLKRLGWILLSLGLSLGLSAFYLLPLIFERKYIVFDEYYRGLAEGHLVELKQLIYSPWGYGFSYPGAANDAMSFQIGLSQILVFLIVVGGLIASLIKQKSIKRFINQLIRFNRKSLVLGLLAIFWFGLGVFLMVNWPATKWFWKNFPGASVIDIPWRFLGLTSLAGALLAAVLIEAVKLKKILLIGLMILVLYANRNHLRINQGVYFDDQHYFNDPGTTTFLNEYRPKWRRSSRTDIVEPRLYVETGQEKVEILENKSNLLVAKTNFDKPTPLQINILYFPGWQVYLKNKDLWEGQLLDKELQITKTGFGEFEAEKIEGTMRLTIPKGPQEIKVEFKETPLRRLANSVSLISLMGLFFLAFFGRRVFQTNFSDKLTKLGVKAFD